MSLSSSHQVTAPILVVNDDAQLRALMARVLERGGYRAREAADAPEARRRLAEERFSLLLCDMDMPGEAGLDLVRSLAGQIPAVMLSGLSDGRPITPLAFESGAYAYVVKPFRGDDLLLGVQRALRRHEAELRTHDREPAVERTVEERADDLQLALARLGTLSADLEGAWHELIRRLTHALAYQDEETGSHIERVSLYCALLAEPLGLDAEAMRLASPMHDIGKIAVPDAILRKPGRLTPGQRAEVERHAELGYRLLSGSPSALLELAATIAWTHHERWDGTGYPRGLKGDEIPVAGQAAAIADVFDALTSDRPYRPAMRLDDALDLIRTGSGTQFAPAVVDAFFERLDDILAIRASTETA